MYYDVWCVCRQRRCAWHGCVGSVSAFLCRDLRSLHGVHLYTAGWTACFWGIHGLFRVHVISVAMCSDVFFYPWHWPLCSIVLLLLLFSAFIMPLSNVVWLETNVFVLFISLCVHPKTLLSRIILKSIYGFSSTMHATGMHKGFQFCSQKVKVPRWLE